MSLLIEGNTCIDHEYISSQEECCICLNTTCDYSANCCDNKMHKSCLITWLIYKGSFCCPLCRSNNIKISRHDLCNTSIVYHDLTETQIIDNLNHLLQTTIDIPNEITHRGCFVTSTPRMIRMIRYNQCLYLLYIFFFYGIFCYIAQHPRVKNK